MAPICTLASSTVHLARRWRSGGRMVQIRKALAPGIALCGARGGDEVGSCPGVHLASADSRGSVVSYGSLGCRRCRRGRPLAPLPIFRIRPPVVERLYVALLDAAVAAALRAAVAVAVDCEPEAPYGRDDVGPRPGETSNEPSAAEGFMAPATHGHKSLASSAKDSAASANSATPKLSSWPAKPASLAHWPSLQHTSDRMPRRTRCRAGPPSLDKPPSHIDRSAWFVFAVARRLVPVS